MFLNLSGQTLLLRAETTYEALSRSPLKDKVRKWILSLYYQQFDFFFPIGSNSQSHYFRMSISKEKMVIAPYSIDVDFFQKQVDKWLPQREVLRSNACI